MVDPTPAKPSEVLASSAVGLDDESHEYWTIIHELQRRGDRETFQVAAALASSQSSRAREVGLNVLAQLGFSEGRPFLEESLPVAITAVSDPDLAVKLAGISALGHLGDSRALSAVLAQRAHQREDVRLAVTIALPAVAEDPPAGEAVDALLELMADPDPDVRDWATFGLGTRLEVDSDLVRDALAARLNDPDGDTAGEALVGLAVRHDPRALDHALRWLDNPECGNLVVEAAAALGAPVLLAALLRLKARGWGHNDARGEWLDKAITACSHDA